MSKTEEKVQEEDSLETDLYKDFKLPIKGKIKFFFIGMSLVLFLTALLLFVIGAIGYWSWPVFPLLGFPTSCCSGMHETSLLYYLCTGTFATVLIIFVAPLLVVLVVCTYLPVRCLIAICIFLGQKLQETIYIKLKRGAK